ncbi:MAG TPA: hypothetical protein VHH73_08085 [Verrucomicrobiae bacterium]|nr:hypothetical protein [Verrucomicrobiae bacterium]
MNTKSGIARQPGWPLWIWLIAFALALPVLAQDPPPAEAPPEVVPLGQVCIVCGKVIPPGPIFKHPKGMVCPDCIKLETRCSLCGLPVLDVYMKTRDGRYICKYDATNVVATAEGGVQVYDETASQLRGWADGAFALKSTNVTVSVFDVDYWNSKDSEKPMEGELRKTGFSQTRPEGKTWVHNVILLSGRLKAETADTCAHEYTHLWINENKPAGRKIEQDTIEAICELSAFKLAGARGDTAEQERIRTNTYTKGKILAVIDGEAQQGFDSVLKWVREGTESAFPSEGFGAAPVRAGFVPPPPPPRAPDKLLLRGFSGTKKRRFAQINDQTFLAGEEARVHVAGGTMLVRCVEIRDDSVLVKVDGGEPMLLLLGAP